MSNKIPRQHMSEQKPKERIKNFKEVPFGYTEEEALKEALRCIQCKNPLCVQGCPVRDQIPEFIYSCICFVNFLSKAGKDLSGFITEKLNQNIFFIFEIKIDRTIGNTRFSGNLRNR